MCFPQNSSWVSSVSGPFSGDQPCSDPCGLLLLCRPSPSALPSILRGAGWGCLALVFRLRKQPLFLQLHGWPVSQPGRICIVGRSLSLSGEGAMGGLELVSSSSPFPMPLPHLLPLAVPGRPSSLLCHPDTSVPSSSLLSPAEPWNLEEASPPPFSGEPSYRLSPRVLRSPSDY